jgi:hypothetical protein
VKRDALDIALTHPATHYREGSVQPMGGDANDILDAHHHKIATKFSIAPQHEPA